MFSTGETLAEEVIRVLKRYDCRCLPSFENQLGTYQACKNLGDIWGVKSSASSLNRQPPSVSDIVPTTSFVDPSPTVTTTPSPSLFEYFQRKNKISYNFASKSQFDVQFIRFKLLNTTTANKLSRFQDTQLLGNSSIVCSTKKRRQEDPLMDFFDFYFI